MLDSIKRVRELTGAGMMDVKKALSDAAGDEEKAIALLRERGIVKAAKKADREASEGLIRAFIAKDGKVGAMVEVNSETDFVARNEEFQNLVSELAQFVAEHGQINGEIELEMLTDQRMPSGESVGQRMSNAIAKIGENLILRRAVRFASDGFIASYVHANDKIGVLLELSNGSSEAVAKDLTLHIAAERPRYLSRTEVNQGDLDAEKEILTNKALNEGKSAEIVEKIVNGQLSKFYEENVLLEQKFVKDNNITIAKLLPAGVDIKRFVRFEIGVK